jgi:universal stress protein A
MAYPFKKILCPIDFDDNSIAALETAAEMARQLDATVEVLHVVPIVVQPGASQVQVDVYAAEEESSKAKLARLAKAHLAGVKYELKTAVALPSTAILRAEKNLDADVIVMSTHGRRGLSRLFMGSVAERVVREAHCPVLTVHGRLTAETTASAPA